MILVLSYAQVSVALHVVLKAHALPLTSAPAMTDGEETNVKPVSSYCYMEEFPFEEINPIMHIIIIHLVIIIDPRAQGIVSCIWRVHGAIIYIYIL